MNTRPCLPARIATNLPVLFLVACLLSGLTSACSKNEDPPSQDPPDTITGRERLGWDQMAPDAEELSQYSYVVYVDGVGVPLASASCGPLTGEIPTASCSSPLPPLRPGTHTLELGTRITWGDVVLESERSAPLVVTVAGSGTAGAASQGLSAAPGSGVGVSEAGYVVETVVGGLDSPSALARLPDGRLLVAEHGGVVRVVRGGLLLEEPAVALAGTATGLDSERVSIAVSPNFAATRHVYLGYAALDGDGARIGRVVCFRETGGTLGDPAVVLDGLPAEAAAPRIGIGLDGVIYVAAAAFDPIDADDLGSYAGKILRFSVSGATPADNPIPSSPVFSFGHRGRLAFDWEPASQHLWYVEAEDGGVAVGQTNRGRRGQRLVHLEHLQAVDVAFHSGSALAAWRGSLFLASPDQECLYRVSGLTSSPPGPAVERLFANAYGRIVAVLSADDGLYFATGNGGANATGQPADAVYRVRDKPVGVPPRLPPG